MASLFNSTRNTRSILPDSFRYLRSDVPEHLSDTEIKWLAENNILTIIDLRTDSERSQKRSCLEQDTRFRYFSMPVTGGNTIPESQEEVAVSYIRMADENMGKILDRILNAQTGVLYFCNAGKDRTGVVSALLLEHLGLDREYIIRDYLESRENLRELLEGFASAHQADLRVITPCRSYMETFLNWLENEKRQASG